MNVPDDPRLIANHKPLSTDQLIALVTETRRKVADAAEDLEMLSSELRRRLGEVAEEGERP